MWKKEKARENGKTASEERERGLLELQECEAERGRVGAVMLRLRCFTPAGN